LAFLISVEDFSASADQPGLTPLGMCALTGAHKKRPAQMSRSFVAKKIVFLGIIAKSRAWNNGKTPYYQAVSMILLKWSLI